MDNTPKSIFFILTLVPLISADFKLDCNNCKCEVNNKAGVIADCSEFNSKYTFEILKSSNLNFGPNVIELNLKVVCYEKLANSAFANANIRMNNISIESCEIKVIEKDAFRNLTNLKVLNAAYNKISRLEIGTFDDNRNLEDLDFGENEIEILKNGLLDNLLSLRRVSFRKNRIKQIGDNFFTTNVKLENIDLTKNHLSYMNGGMLEPLKNLQILEIRANPWICSNCKLRSLRVKSLKYMDGSKNYPKCNDSKKSWDDIGKNWKCPFLPRINVSFSVDSSLEGLKLFCNVTAYPKLNHPNFYNTNPAKSSVTEFNQPNEYSYEGTIAIDNIYSVINDTYECLAPNNEGTSKKNIVIWQIYSENVGSQQAPINISIESDNSVELNCIHFTFKKTKILWYFLDKSVQDDNFYRIIKTETQEGGTLSKLIIKNVKPLNGGIYRCTNPEQNETQYFQLVVKTEEIMEFKFNIALVVIPIVIVLVIVIIIIIIVLYFRRFRKDSKNRKTLESKTENEHESNEDYCIVESNIYISSDVNVYEDIKIN